MKNAYSSISQRLLLAPILFILPVLARELPVGDARDDDPHTFTFKGRISPADLTSGSFRLLVDGTDAFSEEYTWKLGYSKPRPILRPKVRDLSDAAGWPAAHVEPGFVAIDPRTRRFAFARENKITEPKLVHRVMLPNFCAWQIDLRKKDLMLFLANEEESHCGWIIDVADPYDLKVCHRQPMASYPFTVRVWGDHAYFGQNYHLAVVDAKDPRNAKLVYEPFQNWDGGAGQRCQRMGAHDGHLYTTSGSMLVWDLSDPAAPTPIANVPRFAYDVVGFRGKLGFFVYGNLLRIADLSNPARPKIVHDHRMKQHIGIGRIAGNYAFLAQSGGVHILDVSQPTAPRSVAVTECTADFKLSRLTMFSCAVETNQVGQAIRLYQCYGRRNGAQTVECYDLTDIAKPALLSRYEPPLISDRGRVILHDCIAHEGILYTSSAGFGVLALDYRNPKQPKEADYVMTGGELRGMKLLRDKLCAFGMAVYVIPTYPPEKAYIEGVGWHSTTWFGGPLWGNANTKSKVVIASGVHGGSQAYDITDPKHPKLDTRWPAGVNGLWIRDTLYTIGTVPKQRTLHLLIDDTSNGGPVRQATLDLSLTGRATLTRYQNRLFICGQGGREGNSVVVDVANPKAPKALSRFDVPGGWIVLVSEIDYKHPYLFVPRKAVGVNVIDMSDPAHPKSLPPISPTHHDISQRILEWCDGVYVWGDRLYVADYRTGMKVINIADIRNPRFEHHFLDQRWANYSYSVCIDGYGRYVYNGGIGTIELIEINSPSEAPTGKVSASLGP